MSTAFIGTYTDHDSRGIYQASFDAATGVFSGLKLAAELAHPSWLSIDRERNILYAASEVEAGEVVAYAIDEVTFELGLIDRQSTGGANPCHLALSDDGSVIAAANYVSGSLAVLAVSKLGLGAALIVSYVGKGADPIRQDASHPHSVAFDGDGRLWVADLGLDRLLSYKMVDQKIVLESVQASLATSGAGPRHLVFHPSLPLAYLICELDSTIRVYVLAGGVATLQSSISTLPPGAAITNRAGGLAIHPSGRFLYATNRGDESIAHFAIDSDKGQLRLMKHTPAGGIEPRSAIIDPSGNYLVVTNQKSNEVVILAIDAREGYLMQRSRLAVPSPTCVAWIN